MSVNKGVPSSKALQIDRVTPRGTLALGLTVDVRLETPMATGVRKGRPSVLGDRDGRCWQLEQNERFVEPITMDQAKTVADAFRRFGPDEMLLYFFEWSDPEHAFRVTNDLIRPKVDLASS